MKRKIQALVFIIALNTLLISAQSIPVTNDYPEPAIAFIETQETQSPSTPNVFLEEKAHEVHEDNEKSANDFTDTVLECKAEPVTQPPVATQHVHAYTATVVPPTCTSQGYSIYQCDCGDKYTANVVTALHHQWTGWSVISNPTWFETGLQSRECRRCNAKETCQISPQTIANTGTITVPANKNVLDDLIEPNQTDFGKYYNNALTLYNAFITQQEDWCYLFFDAETYAQEYEEWRIFKRAFEKHCFQDNSVLIYAESYATGAFREGAGLTRIKISATQTQELYTACCNVLQAMNLSTGMSQYDAVLCINEWMRSNLTYNGQFCTPLAALQTGNAQCAGYASLFEYLCAYIGINATKITGCTGHEGDACQYGCHAWNRVKLAGAWYYIDVCWNDSTQPNRYSLVKELWAGRSALSELKTA